MHKSSQTCGSPAVSRHITSSCPSSRTGSSFPGSRSLEKPTTCQSLTNAASVQENRSAKGADCMGRGVCTVIGLLRGYSRSCIMLHFRAGVKSGSVLILILHFRPRSFYKFRESRVPGAPNGQETRPLELERGRLLVSSRPFYQRQALQPWRQDQRGRT